MSCPREWCSPTAPFCAQAGGEFDLVAFCTSSTPGACDDSDAVYLGSQELAGVKCKRDPTTGKVTCTDASGQPAAFTCPASCGVAPAPAPA